MKGTILDSESENKFQRVCNYDACIHIASYLQGVVLKKKLYTMIHGCSLASKDCME